MSTQYSRLCRFLFLLASCTFWQGAEAQSTAPAASALEVTAAELFNVHGQLTVVTQQHGAFASPYMGSNSLRPDEGIKETVDGTLFLGLRLWRNGELYINPEFDQGYGLSGTTGVAGFTSGAAYKVGHDSAYGRLQRLFLRQTYALDDEMDRVESGPNALAGASSKQKLTLTLGKFSVVDIFDSNSYAHDPRADFLNWAVIDGAAFDYAADAWGYTYGIAADWTERDWTWRGGFFAMSTEPNAESIDRTFNQREWVAELEHRHEWRGHPGTLRMLVFLNQARMAYYADAVALALASGQNADTSNVRHRARKTGFVLGAEQELAKDVGVFARFSRNRGDTEAYDFTDVNQSLSGGLSVQGNLWSQPAHRAGVAFAVNGLSKEARAYFAAGGAGILIGDGQLPHYATEQILELYYTIAVSKALTVTADFQHVGNPAYNLDRGPVSIAGLRLHAEF